MYPEVDEKEKVLRALKGIQFDRERHGSLFDRGSADSYYGRGRNPHYWPEGTGHGSLVDELTKEEVDEYMAGYDWNEKHGDKKSWD